MMEDDFAEWVAAYLGDGSYPEIGSAKAQSVLVRLARRDWDRNFLAGPRFRHRDNPRVHFRSWAVEEYPFLFKAVMGGHIGTP